jgi:ferredoxin-NADP reductase
MRVIREGHVQAGDPILKISSGSAALTVADTDALLYLPQPDPAKLRRAVQIPALSPGWQQSFHDLLAGQAGGTTTPEPAWRGFRPLRVARVVAETSTVSSIYLADPDGNPLPTARAGQYLTVRIAQAGPPPAVRSYSLSSGPDTGTYRISVKHEPHGLVSTYLHRRLKAGAILEVAAPRGAFVLDDATTPVVLLSAGIGVTPVLSMLHQLAAQQSPRHVWWIHAARRPQEHALAAEAHTLITSLPHAHQHIFYSVGTAQKGQRGRAASGRLTKDKVSRLSLPAEVSAYLCGPTSFMTDMHDALIAVGIAPSHIHTELFAALPPVTPGLNAKARPAPHQPVGPPGTGPLVTFARSGISTPFNTDTASLLDLADACDISTRWSCRTGVCHTCTTPLLSGEVTYHPTPLEPPAGGEVLICCARPDTDAVLDL